ncbi:MAG: hypothetical protein HQ594_02055 [Candidatus Omnitrophica bacterium]|nr:hypothetical protein [Candidatus Omnitrophota bacterium]
MEIAAALFALGAAIAILVRFFAIGGVFYLVIGLGFLIAGAEDMVHGVISLERLTIPLSGYEKFIPGTYVAGRAALVLMLIIGAIYAKIRARHLNVKREIFIYGSIALMVGILLTGVAAMLPLPRFIYPGNIISRPVDLIVGMFYLLAIPLYMDLYSKNKEPFHWSLVASLIFGMVAQVYMVHSQQLYDAQFDLSHIFKIASYICPSLGIAIGTIVLYRNQEVATSELNSAKTELEDLTKNLEKKVEERTKELTSSQTAILNMMEDLQKSKDELGESLKKERSSRGVLTSMLDDNNQIRKQLEEKIEELESTQSMLVQSEKMISLGRLVSEMAHEVNNPLMIISARAQLAQMGSLNSKELEKSLGIIETQCYRASDIIQRLLTFSKPPAEGVEKMNINKAIEDAANLLEHQYSLENIKISGSYAEDLPSANINKNQMEEVFVNLMKNAAEAMPEGGDITVSSSLEGNMVKVELKDTGSGIPKDIMNSIFDPFFTTKKDGTGLGLSVCYGIIKAHGGDLKYKSKEGEGTTAIITLPVAEG